MWKRNRFCSQKDQRRKFGAQGRISIIKNRIWILIELTWGIINNLTWKCRKEVNYFL